MKNAQRRNITLTDEKINAYLDNQVSNVSSFIQESIRFYIKQKEKKYVTKEELEAHLKSNKEKNKRKFNIAKINGEKMLPKELTNRQYGLCLGKLKNTQQKIYLSTNKGPSVPTIILGKMGTGKTYLINNLFQQSKALDCFTLCLLEGDLFNGHVKKNSYFQMNNAQLCKSPLSEKNYTERFLEASLVTRDLLELLDAVSESQPLTTRVKAYLTPLATLVFAKEGTVEDLMVLLSNEEKRNAFLEMFSAETESFNFGTKNIFSESLSRLLTMKEHTKSILGEIILERLYLVTHEIRQLFNMGSLIDKSHDMCIDLSCFCSSDEKDLFVMGMLFQLRRMALKWRKRASYKPIVIFIDGVASFNHAKKTLGTLIPEFSSLNIHLYLSCNTLYQLRDWPKIYTFNYILTEINKINEIHERDQIKDIEESYPDRLRQNEHLIIYHETTGKESVLLCDLDSDFESSEEQLFDVMNRINEIHEGDQAKDIEEGYEISVNDKPMFIFKDMHDEDFEDYGHSRDSFLDVISEVSSSFGFTQYWKDSVLLKIDSLEINEVYEIYGEKEASSFVVFTVKRIL